VAAVPRQHDVMLIPQLIRILKRIQNLFFSYPKSLFSKTHGYVSNVWRCGENSHHPK
jgi:hypothetical protein